MIISIIMVFVVIASVVALSTFSYLDWKMLKEMKKDMAKLKEEVKNIEGIDKTNPIL
jgi:uncharacterized membrane protein (DUF106 family)